MCQSLWTPLWKKWKKCEREKIKDRCPSVDRVMVEEDNVDFFYQFARDSSSKDTEYIRKNSSNKLILKDTSKNLIGNPTTNQNNNKFSKSFVMASSGFEISTTWQKQVHILSPCDKLQDDRNIFYNYIGAYDLINKILFKLKKYAYVQKRL
ncbi:PREDICTED: uncharacterized protein LOC105562420 [Vollenhovia emeryi]|uniref:uncharacterized protein LOC105562420 n=1 Tax=Vollenhovia emeryi TaxID=411798 RepID=UPI0005F4F72A|nr:PREDICTED: uncharacterized protein LOC105562420 [Vollenhovia emeryi]